MTDSRATKSWVWRGVFLAVLFAGWAFIVWQNHSHISAPLIVICLGYLAVVATVANLWRTGASAVATDEHENDSTWAKPAGALGELEREKRTLLKAIKEAEFDHEMGKLSKHDVDDMIRAYRGRAIEVIKEIDRLESGATGTAREQIMREVRARLELEARSQKKPDAKAAKPAAAEASGAVAGEAAASAEEARGAATSEAPIAAREGDAAEASADLAVEAKADAASATSEAKPVTTSEAKPEATSEAKPEATTEASIVARSEAAPVAKDATSDAKAAKSAKAEAKSKKRAAAKVDAKSASALPALDDEGMDADSTTTVEPKRNDPAKEATP